MANFRITFGAAIVGFFLTGVALGAPPQHHGWHHDWHHGGYYRGGAPFQAPNYDPKSEITVSGIVDRVWTEDCLRCACDGAIHFTFDADGVTHEAHLGPTCYLGAKGWQVVKGDAVEVTGAVLPHPAAGHAIVVREIKRGSESLVLRGKTGIPLWSEKPCW